MSYPTSADAQGSCASGGKGGQAVSLRCSVVIPVYNHEKYIRECVESVLSQSVSELEVLVIDDCSTDDTPEIVSRLAEADPRIRFIRLEHNGGVAHARNLGVRMASADWIAFLDSDDSWKSEKLAKELALAEQSGAGLIYTGFVCTDTEGNEWKRSFSVPPAITYRDMLRGNDIVTSSVLAKRELLLAHPMADGDFHEDFVCWLSLLRDGCKAVGVLTPLVNFRRYPSSRSGNKLRSMLYAWRSYRMVGLGPLSCARYLWANAWHGIRRYLL